MSRLKDLYKDEIVEAMIKKFGYKNVMEVPKLDKIVINMGVGEAKVQRYVTGTRRKIPDFGLFIKRIADLQRRGTEVLWNQAENILLFLIMMICCMRILFVFYMTWQNKMSVLLH